MSIPTPSPTPSPIPSPPPLSARVLGAGLDQLVQRGLRGIWLRGELPGQPFVWAANHHSWWDGFLARAVLGQYDRAFAVLMDGANLGQFGFLRALGAVSAQRPREALQALHEGRVLVVFPERELFAPGELRPVARGAGWLAAHASVALVPVAVRVTVRAHQYPEVFIDLGAPVAPAALAGVLSDQLRTLDADLTTSSADAPLDGFHEVVHGRRDWDERITRWSRIGRRG